MVWMKKGLCGTDIRKQSYSIAAAYVVSLPPGPRRVVSLQRPLFCPSQLLGILGIVYGFMLIEDPDRAFRDTEAREEVAQVEEDAHEEEEDRHDEEEDNEDQDDEQVAKMRNATRRLARLVFPCRRRLRTYLMS